MKLTVFKNSEFGSVRATSINGEPWIVGKDAAVILGYSNSRDALAKHVDDEDKGVAKCDTLGGVQDLVVINESGLYSLIFGSKLPKAKEFKHWVTSEVLPSIRKNGGYISGQESMTDSELIARALLVAQRKIEERDKRIEQMRPKEIFADAVSASNTTILIGELAKILKANGCDVGQNRLFKILRKIADALNVNPAWLDGLDAPMEIKKTNIIDFGRKLEPWEQEYYSQDFPTIERDEEVTRDELDLLTAYRDADVAIRAAVRKLLDLPEVNE